MGWMFVVVPGLIWGASFLFIAEGLQAVAPMGVTFVRIAIGFATLSLVPSARRPILREDRPKTGALGILWLAFPLSMFPFAEQHVSSALAGMLNGATPLFAALVASLLARRAPQPKVALGLAVGFAGAVLIALPGLSNVTTMADTRVAVRALEDAPPVARQACVGVEKQQPVAVRDRSAGVHLLRTAARRRDPDKIGTRRANVRQRHIPFCAGDDDFGVTEGGCVQRAREHTSVAVDRDYNGD